MRSRSFFSYAPHARIVGLREAGITWLNVLEKRKSAPYIRKIVHVSDKSRSIFKFEAFDAYVEQSFRSYDLDSGAFFNQSTVK